MLAYPERGTGYGCLDLFLQQHGMCGMGFQDSFKLNRIHGCGGPASACLSDYVKDAGKEWMGPRSDRSGITARRHIGTLRILITYRHFHPLVAAHLRCQTEQQFQARLPAVREMIEHITKGGVVFCPDLC